MIYQLNNVTHWEISPKLMRELISMANECLAPGADLAIQDPGLQIEMCNFRSALECELHRHDEAERVKTAKLNVLPPDNSDLIG